MRRRAGRAALALGIGLASACDAPPGDAPPAVRAGTLTVDDAEIWYQAIGTGRPIIAIHGGPGLDHSYLLPWLEPLGETGQLILYDQRGLGASPTVLDSASVSITRFLDDIDALRARVANAPKVTLISHSWGSIPALLYAMRWPERVESLILVSPVEPGQRYAEAASEAQTAQRAPEDQVAIDSILATPAFRNGERDAVNRLFFHAFRGTFADPTVADRSFRPRLSERTAHDGRIVASLVMTPLAGLDFWDELPALAVPVLIIHGDRDPIPLEMVQGLASALPRARLVVIDGAGHFPFVEKPEPFVAAVRAFLEERAAEAAPSG